MAQQLQDRVEHIGAKCGVLLEKYTLLRDSMANVKRELSEALEENARLKLQVEQLERSNRMLKLASALAPDAESSDRVRKLLSKMVRDIDKCIAQLNS